MGTKKEITKITVRLVLAWIFSILFIFGGAYELATTSILGGLLRLLAGLIIFPPLTKYCKEKFKFEISTWLKVLIIIILIGLSWGLTNQIGLTGEVINEQTGEIEGAGIETNQQEKESETEIYSFGDKVTIGNFAYIFHSYETETEIRSKYSGDVQEKSDGIFLILDLTVENIGKKSEDFSPNLIKIIDERGREFEHDFNAEIWMDDEYDISYEQIQPGLSKRGKIIFDVPENLKGFIGVFDSSFWPDEVKYVSWN